MTSAPNRNIVPRAVANPLFPPLQRLCRRRCAREQAQEVTELPKVRPFEIVKGPAEVRNKSRKSRAEPSRVELKVSISCKYILYSYTIPSYDKNGER